MFQILDHISTLKIIRDNPTNLVAYCPVCFGDKLKINKNTGSYTCYSKRCSAKDIRNIIAPPNSYTPINFYSTNLYYVEKTEPEKIQLQPPYVFSSINPISYCRRISDRERYFYYSKVHRVQRYENSDKKKCYPQYLEDNSWQYGKGNVEWPLYAEDILKNTTEYILIVEGEKCVESLLSLGYVATTPPAFGFTPSFLESKLEQLQPKGVLYLMDNDIPGITKKI